MDRFLVKRKGSDSNAFAKVSDSEGVESSSEKTGQEIPQKRPRQQQDKKTPKDSSAGRKIRQYSSEYLGYGFVSNGADPPLPLCIICNETLSNHSMKPSLLKRHLQTKHAELKDRPLEYFKRQHESMMKGTAMFHGYLHTSEKALRASYEVSLLVAKTRKSHTIVEALVLPAALKIAEIMLDKKAVDTVKTIPHSDDTVSRRIREMADDVVLQVCEQIKLRKQFALQLDESTDVSNEAQLMIFVRYVDEVKGLSEEVLACKALPGKTTAQEIFRILSECLAANGLEWMWCVSVCTDGAANMTGHRGGLKALVKGINPSVQWNHCIIHRQSLASNHLSVEFNETLNTVVKVVNFIKSRALNSRLFRLVCQDMGAEHVTLFLHTEVRWLSHGKVLNRLFELRQEIYVFLRDQKSAFVMHFENEQWLCKVAYLADIFAKINELNFKLQGQNGNIFSSIDNVRAFHRKVIYWKNRISAGHLVIFPTISCFCEDSNIGLSIFSNIKALIIDHLKNLANEILRYFPEIETDGPENNWILNPFCEETVETAELPDHLKEKLFELAADRTLKARTASDVGHFWHSVRQEYEDLSNAALAALLPFPSTYLCESAFSALTAIKTKERNRLQPEGDVILAVSSIHPRINSLMAQKQAQVSH